MINDRSIELIHGSITDILTEFFSFLYAERFCRNVFLISYFLAFSSWTPCLFYRSLVDFFHGFLFKEKISKQPHFLWVENSILITCGPHLLLGWSFSVCFFWKWIIIQLTEKRITLQGHFQRLQKMWKQTLPPFLNQVKFSCFYGQGKCLST